MGLGQLIMFLVMGLVLLGNYLRYRDALYPPVIQAASWMAVVLLYTLNRAEMVVLSPLFYFVVVAGLVFFSLGSYLATRKAALPKIPLPEVAFAGKRWYANLLFWLSLLGLLPFLLLVRKLGLEGGPYDNFYMNMRFAAITADDARVGDAFGLFAFLLPISYVSALTQTLFATYRTHPLRYTISLALALTYALGLTGRTPIIMLLMSVAGVLVITRRVSVAKITLTFGSIILALFAAIGLALRLADPEEGGLVDIFDSLYELFLIYVAGSLPAFDLFLQSSPLWEGGSHTFRTFYAVLFALGADVTVAPVIQPYEYVPFPTNVYTMFQPFYADFGLWGVFLAPLFLGYVHGFIYKKAMRGHLFFMLLYALSLYPLVLQFYQDHYFSLLSLWLQYGLLFFLYFYRLRLLPPAEPACVPSTSSS